VNDSRDAVPDCGERALDLWCVSVEALHVNDGEVTYARDNRAHLRNSTLPLFVVIWFVVTVAAKLYSEYFRTIACLLCWIQRWNPRLVQEVM
jgi:hypothetical protein